jgi:hypothetical protein
MSISAVPTFPAFERCADFQVRISSALAAARAILHSEALPIHKRELLGICIWKLSEAEATRKYATRYMSVRALGQPAQQLAHEHVFERSKLARALIAGELAIDDLPDLAIACVVTREEHRRLNQVSRADPTLDGWDRYRAASIAVVDRAENLWKITP